MYYISPIKPDFPVEGKDMTMTMTMTMAMNMMMMMMIL